MKSVQELKEKLNKILEKSLFTENSTSNRNNIYLEIRALLDKNGLEDLSLIVESMKYMIDRYSHYIPMNYEDTANQIYIGPLPIAPLKDKLAWNFLTQNNDKDIL